MSHSSHVQPAVSVLVLNWNGAHYLHRCLDALAAQSFQDAEFIVLDNASTDGSENEVASRPPPFRLVRFEQNLGFAAGNNRGAALASGRRLAFLNNDAFPAPDWLEHLNLAADEYPRFSFFASRLVCADDPAVIQAAGDILHISGAAWGRAPGRSAKPISSRPEEVFSASAAAMLIDSSAFHEVGGFNEDFRSHLEDVDLGLRLRLHGHRCLYVPDAIAEHIGGASYGVESAGAIYQVQRNMVWLYASGMPGSLFWKHLPAHLIANLVFLAFYTLRGRGGAVWRAKLDALKSLRFVLGQRKILQDARRTNPTEIDRMLDHSLTGPYLLGKRGASIHRILGHPPTSPKAES